MKKYFILIIVGVFFAISTGTKASDKSKNALPANSADKLIAKNVEYPRPLWCRTKSKKLVYTINYAEIYIYDIKTHKKQLVKTDQTRLMACTNNGSRIIYLDTRGTYSNDDREADSIGVWSFDFNSYTHELIAVAYANDILALGNNIISPDGKTMLLGRRPIKKIKALDDASPKVIWNKGKRTPGHGYRIPASTLWLKGSSAVVKSYWDNTLKRDILDLEDIKTKEKITLDPKAGEFLLWRIDSNNRLYLKGWNNEKTAATKILRCELNIKEKRIDCVDIIERPQRIIDFDILDNGKAIAFSEEGGNCVEAITVGNNKARCITEPKEHFVYNFAISPDGSHIAYLATKGKTFLSIENDLYLADIKER